jgi:CYTH domain-containing protein
LRSERGSKASRRASPTKLKARTTITSDAAVIKKKLGITVTKRVEFESRIPQVEAGG